MKVLHAIGALDTRFGGPSIALAGLARAQRGAGIEVSVASTFIEGETSAAADELRAAGIQVVEIGPTRPGLRKHADLAPKLAEMIASCDVVHIHALFEEIQHQAAQIAGSRGKPYIFRPCGMLDPWSLSQKRLQKQIYMLWRLRRDLNHASALHFTSRMECELAKRLKLRAGESIVEPLGIDLTEFECLPARGEFRARYPQLCSRPAVLFLSRLHPKKGLDLLIPAFARGAPADAMLLLAGPVSEGYGDEVSRMLRNAGLSDRAILTGMLKGRERVSAMMDADLFVLPSYQENFGVVVIEALAAGCPTIISDQVNIHREIAASGAGAVVPTQVEPLAAEISRWLGDSALRAQAASLGPAFVKAQYDWNQIARRWADHYARLVAAQKRH